MCVAEKKLEKNRRPVIAKVQEYHGRKKVGESVVVTDSKSFPLRKGVSVQVDVNNSDVIVGVEAPDARWGVDDLFFGTGSLRLDSPTHRRPVSIHSNPLLGLFGVSPRSYTIKKR